MKAKSIIFLLFVLLLSDHSYLHAQTSIDAIKTEAESEMRLGRFGEAVDLLNRYISSRPQEAEGYYLRGFCYEKRQEFNMAVFDYRIANKLDPGNKEISESLGRATAFWYSLLLNQIEGFKREIAIDPSVPDNYLNIGKAYKNMGNWEAAEEWYDRYRARAHASPDEIIRYSEILAKNNHIAKGWPILKKYTEEYPNDQRLWSRFGYFSLWLGKRKIAIDAFQSALAIKPYFKEALAGLDQAKGKGYNYTVVDTAVRFNYGLQKRQPVFVYPIDRYYRTLRRRPSDNNLRYTLAKALFKVERYEEAYQQVQILNQALYDSVTTFTDTTGYGAFADNVATTRQKHNLQQIADYRAKLKADSTDKKAMLKLAEYYSVEQNYDSAMILYDNYLRLVPGDSKVNFLYAKAAANNQEFNKAKARLVILLHDQPDNLQYQLFDAQLFAWSAHDWNQADLDTALIYLKNVLDHDKNNVEALITLSSLHIFYTHDFDKAQDFLNRAKEMDPSNNSVAKLQSDMAIQRSLLASAKIFAILQEGRKLAGEGDCEEALPKYEEYLDKAPPNILIRKEYADVNVCAKNYEKAVGIYDDILSKGDNPDVELQRAKVYYYMGDTVNSLSAFQKLAVEKPNDFIINMYLGDSYVKMHEFGKAEDVYDDIEDNIQLDSTQSAMIEQRRTWLPVTGLASMLAGFPNYTLLTPYASYYTDNLGISSNTQGLRLDLGLNRFLSVGAEAFRTTMAGSSAKVSSNTIKWNLTFKLTSVLSAGVGFGNSNYGNLVNRPVANAYVRAEQTDKYLFNLGYSKLDASQIIFSEPLISVRLYAKMIQFNGSYKFNSGVKVSAYYNNYKITDGNSGNSINFRIGKYFYPDFIMGYEYNASFFAITSPFYFSPTKYESHSLWGEWDLFKDSTASLTLGGMIGEVSNTNFILRQLYANGNIKLARTFTLQGRIVAGSSYQSVVGYSSYSSVAVYLSAYWSL